MSLLRTRDIWFVLWGTVLTIWGLVMALNGIRALLPQSEGLEQRRLTVRTTTRAEALFLCPSFTRRWSAALPPTPQLRGGDAAEQVFLLLLAFGADGEGVEHA